MKKIVSIFEKRGIGSRLIIGFSFILILCIGVNIFSYLNNLKTNFIMNNINNKFLIMNFEENNLMLIQSKIESHLNVIYYTNDFNLLNDRYNRGIKTFAQYNEAINFYEKNCDDNNILEVVKKCKSFIMRLQIGFNDIYQTKCNLIKQYNGDIVQIVNDKNYSDKLVELTALNNELISLNDELKIVQKNIKAASIKNVQELDKIFSNYQLVIILVTLVVVICSVFLATNISKSIINPLNKIKCRMLEFVKTGKVEVIETAKFANNEIDEIFESLNMVMKNIDSIIKKVQCISNDDLYNTVLREDLNNENNLINIEFKKMIKHYFKFVHIAEKISEDKLFDKEIDMFLQEAQTSETGITSAYDNNSKITKKSDMSFEGVLTMAHIKMITSLRALAERMQILAKDELYNSKLDDLTLKGDLGTGFMELKNFLRIVARQVELIAADELYNDELNRAVSNGVLGSSVIWVRDILRVVSKQITLLANDNIYNEELNVLASTGNVGKSIEKLRDILREMSKQAELIAKDDLYSEKLNTAVSMGDFGKQFAFIRDILRMLACQAEVIANDDLQNDILDAPVTNGVLGSAFIKMRDNLRKFANISNQIANGNLNVTLDADITRGALGNSYKMMLDNLCDLVKLLKSLSIQLDKSSEKMLSSASEMSKGLNNQYIKIEEIQSSMEELSTSIQEVEENINQTKSRANQTIVAAKDGQHAVGTTVEGLKTIKKAVDKTSKSMEQLSTRSMEITKIVKAITEISEQTNLLALNAAIEAARAGEQGRGFAVVADEVKKLAEKSASNALEIGQIIERIQEVISHSVDAMIQGKSEADAGEKVVINLESSFQKIQDMVVSTSNAVNEITAVIAQQSRATLEISNSMETITTISKNSADSSQSVLDEASEVKNTVIELNKKIQKFKVN